MRAVEVHLHVGVLLSGVVSTVGRWKMSSDECTDERITITPLHCCPKLDCPIAVQIPLPLFCILTGLTASAVHHKAATRDIATKVLICRHPPCTTAGVGWHHSVGGFDFCPNLVDGQQRVTSKVGGGKPKVSSNLKPLELQCYFAPFSKACEVKRQKKRYLAAPALRVRTVNAAFTSKAQETAFVCPGKCSLMPCIVFTRLYKL